MDRRNPHSQSIYENFRSDFPKWLAGFRGLKSLEVAIPTPEKPGTHGWSTLQSKMKSYNQLIGADPARSKMVGVEFDTYSRFVVAKNVQKARPYQNCQSAYGPLATERYFDEDLVIHWVWEAKAGKMMDWSNLSIEELRG
jgi:hypothetical protein